MVSKKSFNNNPKPNASEKTEIDKASKVEGQDMPSMSKDLENKVISFHEKISDEEIIKKLDTSKDNSKNKSKSDLDKIYDYHVVIYKGDRIFKDFGVKEDTINGVKLLIRAETNKKGELEVIFKELFPEPSFNVETIYNNRKDIKKDLNQLKQLEKELEDKKYKGESLNDLKYDLKDIRLLILEKEIQLDAIQYGKDFTYQFNLPKINIPVLKYDLENNGLSLRKLVKGKGLYTNASEIKHLQHKHLKDQIDSQFKSKKDTNLLRLLQYAMIFLILTLLLVGSYLWFNKQDVLNACMDKLETTINVCNSGMAQAITKINEPNDKLINAIMQNTKSNTDILDSCISSNLLGNAKPTITG